MKLTMKWRDMILSDDAMKILELLHHVGSIPSFRDIERVIGIHHFYARELIAGAKRHRSKLLHLVRYTKIKRPRQTKITITLHGRLFYHMLYVTDIPADEDIKMLARCAVMSAKHRGTLEIVPRKEGIWERVWEEIEKCESCKEAFEAVRVIEVTEEILKAIERGEQVKQTIKGRHHNGITMASQWHRNGITMASLPYSLYSLTAFKPSSLSDESGKKVPVGEGGETERKTHKDGKVPEKCPRCGQQRSRYTVFMCHDPRVRSKDLQLELWHLQLVCEICHEELSDIKWRIIEEGKF